MFSFTAELGDFNPDEHTEGYLSEFRFVQTQTMEFERDVQDMHRQHRSDRTVMCRTKLDFSNTVYMIYKKNRE